MKKRYPGTQYLRRRSVGNVIKELVMLKKTYNPSAFRFEDDVFTHDLAWLKEFAKHYYTHVNLPFHCYVNPTTVTDDTLHELTRAGCVSVSMGVQSGSERIRRNLLNRHGSNDTIITAAEKIRRHGLKLLTEIMFGHPDETPEDMWESVALNEKLKPANTASFIFYPFPETTLTNYCLKNKLLSKDDYERIRKEGIGSYHTTCLLNHPFKDHVYRYNSILPVYTKVPEFVKPVLGKLFEMPYGILHKAVYVVSLPFIDFDEFMIRLVNIPRMVYKTRRVLSG